MSDCFVLYLLLTCMKKKTSGADKFTNNTACTEKTNQRIESKMFERFRHFGLFLSIANMFRFRLLCV